MFRGGTCPAQPFGGQVRRLNEINKGESIVSSRARFLRRILDRLDDVLIAGAAAQISFQAVTNFITRRIRIAIDDLARRDDHSRRAITTLQAVLLPKAFLNGMQCAVVRESFDRRHVRAIGLDGKHRARLHCLTVDEHSAGAADRSFAADVCSGQAQNIAQVMHE